MPDYRFERECRTPSSEAYLISSGEKEVGRVDIHYTSSVVHGTLCVGEDMTLEAIHELIDAVDEELVLTADVPRDDFVVTVFQGRETGVFSDETFEEEFEGDEEEN